MITAPGLALALALGTLPYPAPRVIQPTDRTKCDMGEVLAVDASHGVLRVTTPAGVVTYKAGADVQVMDRNGKPVGTIAKLSPGQKVRVYYYVEDGARAQEVDEE
jgi:hypothetical protein